MSENIVISVITICYNAHDFIAETIESVIQQDYKNVEFIIIDGASVDGTTDIVKHYADNISIFISEPDHGISDAFNKGIQAAHGDIICFLNAGDKFIDPTVLSTVSKDWKEKKPDILFYQMKIGNLGLTPPVKYKNQLPAILNALEIPHQACFCTKKLFEEIGGFNLCIKIRMDYDFFVRCVGLDKRFQYIPKIITNYNDEGVSANIANRVTFAKEALYIRKLYRLPVTAKDYLRVLKWLVITKVKKQTKHMSS